MRKIQVQTLVTSPLHLQSISLSSDNRHGLLPPWPVPSPNTPTADLSSIICVISCPLRWCFRDCISNGEQRTSPLGWQCSLIPKISDILSPVATSSNFASYKSKNIVIFFLMWKILPYSIIAAMGLQFHLNSILLTPMLQWTEGFYFFFLQCFCFSSSYSFYDGLGLLVSLINFSSHRITGVSC